MLQEAPRALGARAGGRPFGHLEMQEQLVGGCVP